MKVCARPRRGGKTAKVLQWAAEKLWSEKDFVVICMNAMEADRLYNLLKPIGAKPDNFHSPTSAMRLRGRRPAIAIDNYEICGIKIDEFDSEVELITITGEPV